MAFEVAPASALENAIHDRLRSSQDFLDAIGDGPGPYADDVSGGSIPNVVYRVLDSDVQSTQGLPGLLVMPVVVQAITAGRDKEAAYSLLAVAMALLSDWATTSEGYDIRLVWTRATQSYTTDDGVRFNYPGAMYNAYVQPTGG